VIRPSTRRQDEAVLSMKKSPLSTKDIADALKLTVHQVYHAVARARVSKKSKKILRTVR